MTPNVKYQRAPQRESIDETYNQAPPSYQSTDAANILGGQPRREYDNLPDDFKFGGMVSEATIDIRMMFIRKVYSILTVQLLATALVSCVSFFNQDYRLWIQSNRWMMWISLFASIGLMLLTFWKRKSYPMNLVFLGAFTVFEAYSISVITSFYESRIIVEALVFTLGIFIALTIFACQSRYDFTSWVPYLFGSLWVLIIFGFMSAFFPHSSTVELIYGVVSALIFSGYILVDTQMVIRHYHVEEEIAAAMSLYLDIINLFLAILRILNSRSD